MELEVQLAQSQWDRRQPYKLQQEMAWQCLQWRNLSYPLNVESLVPAG